MVAVGRPKGQRKAERRLKRELANKQALTTVADGVLSSARAFLNAGLANPVVGFVEAVIALDLAARIRLISPVGYIFGLAGLGVIEAGAALEAGLTGGGAVAGGIGLAVPSIGSKTLNIQSQESLIATSPNVGIKEETVAKPVIQEKGYVPE